MATLTLGKSVTVGAVQSKKGDAVFVERRRRIVAPGSKELREEPKKVESVRSAADEKLRAVLEAAKAREEERKKREAEEAAARHLRPLPRGEEAPLRQGAGLLLQQDPRPGRLPVPGDEVHRRGHRLRQQAEPRPLQGPAGRGHPSAELRHGLRHRGRQGQGGGPAPDPPLLQPGLQH